MRCPGEIIKKFRKDNGYNGEEIGEIIGLSQQQISRLERGERNITDLILERLGKIFPENLLLELQESVEFYKLPSKFREELTELRKENIESRVPFCSDIRASAGTGYINYEESAEEYFEVPSIHAKKGNIAITVEGDSMYPEIKDGDTIVINTTVQEPENHKIMVVNYEGNLFVKKVEIDKNCQKVSLVSINNFYPPIRVTNLENLKIIGKVIYSARNY